MIVVNGVRYRLETAKRLGLVADDATDDDQVTAPKVEPKNTEDDAPVLNMARTTQSGGRRRGTRTTRKR